jgi:methanogenic corrinoid protein MtbC1
MEDILQQIAHCVEFGKVNKASPYPPEMKGLDGADELARMALEKGISASDVLAKGLVTGMEKIGVKFRENKVFVPQVLMSAKAMNTAMQHLKPFFSSGEVKRKGVFIIGTVVGDLHDIGKNLVSMMIEGNGWEVIDLGTDVKAEKYIATLKEHPGSIVGLSALLTTTMASMENIVRAIRIQVPGVTIMVGGAPVTEEFRKKIGADFYSPDPQGAVEYINRLVA